MLIPSIDLMGGKIVQLVQGERKALEFSDFDEWINRFSSFPMVQLIDLDAAKGEGSNAELISEFTHRLPCQVGGGIRSIATAEKMLSLGARRVIFGSALIRDGRPDIAFASKAAAAVGSQALVFAIDSKQGQVAIRGWREVVATTPAEMISILEPFCVAFLYTHIDAEGLMQGIPVDLVGQLRAVTTKQFVAAGGIAAQKEVDQLDAMGIDAVVGMAIYTGKIKLEAITGNMRPANR
jgi:phosphoribosylformimino-5-aminoimidazole carboxamide ribotide isomerase